MIGESQLDVLPSNIESFVDAKPRILFDTKDPALRHHIAIAGRPYWSDTAPGLSGSVDGEGLRAALRIYGEHILNHLDGAFAVVVRSGNVTYAVTDRFSVIPLYVWAEKVRVALSTDPDVLARHLGIGNDLDLVSMAQALQMWYATHPYTFYRAIHELRPASVHRWNHAGEYTATPYWEAQYRGDGSVTHAALAEELAAAIKHGVQRRVRESEQPSLLLSAGADSRGVLFAGAEIQPITCYTFYDVPNAELEGARRLAAAAGQSHAGLRRDPEHYALSAKVSTRLSGGMWSFLDCHATGFIDSLGTGATDLLLTGDFADLMFKSNGLDTRYRQFLGRALPLKSIGSFSPIWLKPRGRIADAWKKPINDRVDQQYLDIPRVGLDESDWWKVGHVRVGTLSRTPHIGGRLAMQRCMPWDSFMADAPFASVYEKLTLSARINADVWERAVRILTPPRARRIANNNVLAPVGASSSEKTARFLYGVAYRKIRKREVDGTPLDGTVTRGSWPNWSHYLATSPVIKRLWMSVTDDARGVIRELRGDDPWHISPAEHASRDALGFGRLLTQALWLDLRNQDA